jgi:hypothetical protein
MQPTLTDQLEAKLRGIDAYYPGTHYACLMDADGRVSCSSICKALASLLVQIRTPHPANLYRQT